MIELQWTFIHHLLIITPDLRCTFCTLKEAVAIFSVTLKSENVIFIPPKKGPVLFKIILLVSWDADSQDGNGLHDLEKMIQSNTKSQPNKTLTTVKREKFAKVKQSTSKLRLSFSLF